MPAESTIERYRDAAVQLLPKGSALPKEVGSRLSQLLSAFAVEPARADESAEVLLRNADPRRASEMLPEWESALGLPGECNVDPPETDSARQGAIAAKLRGRAGHAQAVFESVASALGYTDLEFSRYAPFQAGVSGAGDALTNDGWANVVRICALSGPADESLRCEFEELRRSHGFLDITLEGPMGAEREGTPNYFNGQSLAAATVLADLEPVAVRYGGLVSIQCTIDDGAGGAPSDSPVGTWELYAAIDGVNFTKVDAADAELAKIAPNGNNVVDQWAILDDFPGGELKLHYKHTSGGGTDAEATVHISVW